MTQPSDPTRWLSDPDALPSELRSALSDYAQLGPTPEQRARMFEAIAPVVAPPAQAAAPKLSSALRFKLLAVLLVGAGAWWMSRSAGRDPSTHAAHDTPVAASERSSMLAPTPPATPVAPEERVVALPLPSAEERVPEAKTPPHARTAKRKRPSEPTPQPAPANASATDPQAELSLLSRARRMVLAKPERALELTAEHEAAYPQGMFSEEREVIAVEALVRAGRKSEAEARARNFERAHPRSAHLERMRVILAAP